MPAEYRDLAAESVYEYGARAGVWRLIRMFDEYELNVTWYAAAVALERNPEAAQWVRENDRVDICSHGWRWTESWLMSREEEAEKIAMAFDSFKETTGKQPYGWYYRYGPSVNTRELIVEHGGFTYDSDVYNDDLPYFTEVKGKRHLIVPYTFVYNDGRFVLPQGFGGPSDFVDLCKRAIDEYLREGRAGWARLAARRRCARSSSTRSSRAMWGSCSARTSRSTGTTITRSGAASALRACRGCGGRCRQGASSAAWAGGGAARSR